MNMFILWKCWPAMLSSIFARQHCCPACWTACWTALLASIRRQEWSHVFKRYCSHYTCMLASLLASNAGLVWTRLPVAECQFSLLLAQQISSNYMPMLKFNANCVLCDGILLTYLNSNFIVYILLSSEPLVFDDSQLQQEEVMIGSEIFVNSLCSFLSVQKDDLLIFQ